MICQRESFCTKSLTSPPPVDRRSLTARCWPTNLARPGQHVGGVVEGIDCSPRWVAADRSMTRAAHRRLSAASHRSERGPAVAGLRRRQPRSPSAKPAWTSGCGSEAPRSLAGFDLGGIDISAQRERAPEVGLRTSCPIPRVSRRGPWYRRTGWPAHSPAISQRSVASASCSAGLQKG